MSRAAFEQQERAEAHASDVADNIRRERAEHRAEMRGDWVPTPIMRSDVDCARVTGYGVTRRVSQGVYVALCDSDGVRMTFATEQAASEIAAAANAQGAA
jgi:hypothetical protein